MQKNKHKLDEDPCNGMCSCGSEESIEKQPLWKQKKILIIFISLVVLGIGLYLEFFLKKDLFAQIAFFIVVLIAGYEIIKNALFSIFKLKFNMNVLMSLAAIGSFFIGHGEEGASVMFLFFIAEFLEEYASERAKKSIDSLLKITPETAVVLVEGKEKIKHVHEIKIGDIIVVKPGNRIALDGIVIKGISSVNQAPITGESMPVFKKIGDSVFAGTINEEGYLEIKVTKKSDQTIISRIAKFVETAQKKKSKTEIFVDKFAKYYTPIVILVAILTVIIPVFILGLSFQTWFYRALVLLVVSCPCAMAISTPVSIVSAITSAAKNGVLIKGGSYIEEIKKEKVIVFDKTGTLTEGKPEITDIIPLNNYSKNELLTITASIESKSNHPLAIPIINKAQTEKIKLVNVSEFKSITGKGLKGKVYGKQFYIGKKSFFTEMNISLPNKDIEKLENQGKTLVLISKNAHLIGIITLMDKLRDDSKETIKQIKDRGIITVMLTGDNKKVANAIAEKLGIDEVYSELLPENKAEIIDELLEKYKHVIMVGDGVNDAPALAKAHVGIAMGGNGSDIAIETADIVLMKDDLSKVVYLIDLSNKTMNVVRQNVTASILIKGSFAILALPGFIPLWLAVAVGDMGLSLGVILNALRIGRKKNE
ncbi:Copper-exporting P-type ATPase B [uncultured archaeon]|nr:Copper-exporting P-type ATPase B [uncultured archaeon]